MRLVKEDGTDALPNEDGELWIKGPNVMKGFFSFVQKTVC
jgi:acyl-CoA synthetase (AMP-forming)/AMP-acid ligase II